MMACSLSGLFASRSVRPVAKTSCRFFSLKLESECTPEICDLNKKASCPRLSATRNLARLLNLMDNRIGVTAAACPRWDVIEDTKAVYIIRDMSGLPSKDYLDQQNLRLISFGCIHISLSPTTIWFRVGRDGHHPGYLYPGYFIRIYAPDTIYRPRPYMVMDVKDEVLRLTMPKKKGKWTRNIIMRQAHFIDPMIRVNSINN